MAIRVALHHCTTYSYDRMVRLGPQLIRLRPAPHCRTPIASYSLRVEPREHFLNWQQDPHGNFLARCVFPQATRSLRVEVDLIAEMTVVNPFDFFLESAAEHVPFVYEEWLERELRPFLETIDGGPAFRALVASCTMSGQPTVDFLVALNGQVRDHVGYVIRMEPGVQSPDETLALGSGSCRDSAWLLVQLARHLRLAARFVSGYLIQLTPDLPALEGPPGPAQDFTDLHAWAEVYLPGAGWIGLDPTSGLLAGEGHLPLACTPDPMSAAPITGGLEPCEVEFAFQMQVTRVQEATRVTKPYQEPEWSAIQAMGRAIDRRLAERDVRLTMGGEPTFVSIDDMESPEWNSAAVGTDKRQRSEALIKRLRTCFAEGGLLHYGQGKWYPGESLPRWALACYWRKDGVPIWHNAHRIADTFRPSRYHASDANRFAERLAAELGIGAQWVQPAYEDAAHYLLRERRLPINVDPKDPKLVDPEERSRLAEVFERGLGTPRGFVLPLRRQWQQAQAGWSSGPWPTRGARLFLLPGDSPIGLRLPLDSLPWAEPPPHPSTFPRDPWERTDPLPTATPFRRQGFLPHPTATGNRHVNEQVALRRGKGLHGTGAQEGAEVVGEGPDTTIADLVRTALCVEARQGRLHVFLPPVDIIEDYLDLVTAVEKTAEALDVQVVLEGYHPPHDDRIVALKVTPDPGVIEVNVQPSATWEELVHVTTTLYEQARQTRLGTDKFDLDGRHTGTGGGNHLVLGGATPADSPFLRRPDLLKSLIGYWLNHPSLSYLFSGRFVGPTSQAPRVDEGRRDAIYELQLAFDLVPSTGETTPPWVVDRLFRNLLTDLSGNTHRAEFCIDKLYSPDSASGRLGLLEFRAFEMPPHARMSLTQQLLIRGLIVHFWEQPYPQAPIEWGTMLHDRYLLPHFVWQDFCSVLNDLANASMPLERKWFAPHFEFRFPFIGEIHWQDIGLELRAAIEPWYVLGEEPAEAGTVRYVDSSVERLQVKVTGCTGDRFVVCCNQRRVPLRPTGVPGEFVAGVRYRAWQPPHCLHPTIPVHTPLVFDLVDTWSDRSVAGCTYHVADPAGRNYQVFPVNALEAEARRQARFWGMGHTPGRMTPPAEEPNSPFPTTLDLRRTPPKV